MKIPFLMRDKNNKSIQVMPLSSPQDVDGTNASAQSTAIDGTLVRIVSLDNLLRVAHGSNPTAHATGDIAIPAGGELWLPITDNDLIAVYGGKANISVAGV